MERTLAIIKPDAVKKGLIGQVIQQMTGAGFEIVAMKMLHLSKPQAEGFYAVHREKKFFDELTDFMSSGPCVPLVLQGENIINKYRELMGATDPQDAAPGTIRAQWADNKQNNIVHGSDAPETAAFEIGYFFNELEVVA
jgi:nucleoside-diphosphate kinase